MVTCHDYLVLKLSACHFNADQTFCLGLPVAVSPGDQLLHPEKKKMKAERDSEGDEVDSAHADREHSLSDSVKLLGCPVFSGGFFRAFLHPSV